MAVNTEAVTKIAHLARLAINENDTNHYAQDMSKILGWIEQMNAVDTDAIEPMAHPLDINQPLRDDKVIESDQSKTYQKLAPAVEADLYLVPQVIE